VPATSSKISTSSGIVSSMNSSRSRPHAGPVTTDVSNHCPQEILKYQHARAVMKTSG